MPLCLSPLSTSLCTRSALPKMKNYCIISSFCQIAHAPVCFTTLKTEPGPRGTSFHPKARCRKIINMTENLYLDVRMEVF